MGSIYQRASEVIAWLGEGDAGIEIALSMLHYMNGLGAVKEREVEFRSHLVWSGENRSQETDSFEMAGARFGNLPYWDRIWIKQEIMLNPNVCFWYGRSRVVFSKVGRLVHTYAERRAMCREIFPFRPTDSTFTHPRSLSHLVGLFSRSKTSEVRDRVYGLLSMADNGGHVKIDYNISIPELFLQTINAQITSGHRQAGTPRADLYFLHELVTNLGLSDTEIGDLSIHPFQDFTTMRHLKFSLSTQVFAVVANSFFGARNWMEMWSEGTTGIIGDRLLRMENPKIPLDIDALSKDIYRDMITGDSRLLTGDIILGIPDLGSFNLFIVGRLSNGLWNGRSSHPRLEVVALADYNPHHENLDYFFAVPIHLRFFDRPDFLQNIPILLHSSNCIPTHFTKAEIKLGIPHIAMLVKLLKRPESYGDSNVWSWNDEMLNSMREVTFSEVRY